MRRAGVETTVDAHAVAVAGIVEVVSALPRVYRAFHALLAEVDRRRPQLAVLIDFPDFNLRLAKQLKRRGIPVVYFVSPQVWAWRPGRIKQIKTNVTKMLCIFDFEEDLYRKAGVPVEYVGHPLVDVARPQLSREEFFRKIDLDPATLTVAMLPGSRQKEVSYNLPTMLEAAARLAAARKIQFVVAVAPTLEPRWLELTFLQRYVGRVTIRTVSEATYDALQYCAVAVVASGTATLEAALCVRPMVVVYRVSPLTWLVGKLLVKVPFYSIVNLLAGKLLVPELMQTDFTVQNVFAQVEYLLDHPEAREAMARELLALRARLGPGGAMGRAAQAVLNVLAAVRTTSTSP